MRPIQISKTGTGTTTWVPLNYCDPSFLVGLGLTVSGTITTDVEHTFDNVQDSTVTPIAFKHSTLTAKNANADGNYVVPVRAIRLNNTAGTGTSTLTIIQGGM